MANPLKLQWDNILKALAKAYPDAKSELNFANRYELVVAVILSAQCTDKRVNLVTPALFRACPDFASLAAADLNTIEDLIRQINYYRTKAKNLVRMAGMVCDEFGGDLPSTLEDLQKLPGVGRKTASVVVIESGGAALPVDTHVFRVGRRLGIAKGKNVVEVELSLRKNFPQGLWRELHHWLIFHGRRVCRAAKPDCSACSLEGFCPSSQVTLVRR